VGTRGVRCTVNVSKPVLSSAFGGRCVCVCVCVSVSVCYVYVAVRVCVCMYPSHTPTNTRARAHTHTHSWRQARYSAPLILTPAGLLTDKRFFSFSSFFNIHHVSFFDMYLEANLFPPPKGASLLHFPFLLSSFFFLFFFSFLSVFPFFLHSCELGFGGLMCC